MCLWFLLHAQCRHVLERVLERGQSLVTHMHIHPYADEITLNIEDGVGLNWRSD